MRISRRAVVRTVGGLVAFLPALRDLSRPTGAAAQCACPPPGYTNCDCQRCVLSGQDCLNDEACKETGRCWYSHYRCYDCYNETYCGDSWLSTGNPC